MIRLGIERLLRSPALLKELMGKRIALLAHPASMCTVRTGKNETFFHALDSLKHAKVKVVAAFGPQHGMRGDKQDNMVESDDFMDPVHKIPVFSLYGKVRKPTDSMMESFDILLFDIQDVGCRIYTFLTTLLYVLQAAEKFKKQVWILDRPNPAGRPVEGFFLQPGYESFVGAGPLPMRHGLTMAEAALWFVHYYKMDMNILRLIKMTGYQTAKAPGYGWPLGKLPWVNPSPNASSLSMARAYSGTVLIEGTTLSEGRGTTRPLEIVGAPDIDMQKILKWMEKAAPKWLLGCKIRPCFFQPTFHKHAGKLCQGFQIHVDDESYNHDKFKPYRLIALWLKAIRAIHPDYPIWRDFHYEYEKEKLAIDVINGGPALRLWIDNPKATPKDLDQALKADERFWIKEREDFLLYG